MKVTCEIVGHWKENSYFIQSGNDAFLIDPGENFTALEQAFNLPGKNVLGILNTHGHFDHLGAVEDFRVKYSLPFYLHSKDKQLVRQANLYRRLAGDIRVFPTPKIDFFLDDVADLFLHEKQITIHHTPGHSQGSVCFEIDSCLFSGDVFFREKIGRTDLPGGNQELLKISVEFILDNFFGYTIYPGHGEPFVLDETVAATIKAIL